MTRELHTMKWLKNKVRELEIDIHASESKLMSDNKIITNEGLV